MNTDGTTVIVTALIKPSLEGKVIRALHDLPEFPGFTVAEVRGQGRGRGQGGAYRATEYDFTYQRHLQLQVICSDTAAQRICDAIANAAWTGHKGDGVIYTATANSFVRIREAGQSARKAPK